MNNNLNTLAYYLTNLYNCKIFEERSIFIEDLITK